MQAIFSPSLFGCNKIQRSLESFLRSGYLLENTIRVFGVLNLILSLSYLEVVACPSLMSSKIRYKFKSSPDTDRESLNRNVNGSQGLFLQYIAYIRMLNTQIKFTYTMISIKRLHIVLKPGFTFVTIFAINPNNVTFRR